MAGPSPPRNGTGNGSGPHLPPPKLIMVKCVVTDRMKIRIDKLHADGGFTSEAEALRFALKAGLDALEF